MKTKLTIMLGSILAVTTLTLNFSAEPASATVRSCLTMYTGYVQAEQASLQADNTLWSFEQYAQQYFSSPTGEYRVTGWYENFLGGIEHYDVTYTRWNEMDDAFTASAEILYQESETAYSDYSDTCGY